MHNIPRHQQPQRDGTFVTYTDTSPSPRVYTRVHEGLQSLHEGSLLVLSFYEFGQIHNDMYPPLLYQTQYSFTALKILCSTYSSFPRPSPNRYENKDAITEIVWCWQQQSWIDHQNKIKCFETGPNTYESLCTTMTAKSGEKERLFNKWTVPIG